MVKSLILGEEIFVEQLYGVLLCLVALGVFDLLVARYLKGRWQRYEYVSSC